MWLFILVHFKICGCALSGKWFEVKGYTFRLNFSSALPQVIHGCNLQFYLPCTQKRCTLMKRFVIITQLRPCLHLRPAGEIFINCFRKLPACCIAFSWPIFFLSACYHQSLWESQVLCLILCCHSLHHGLCTSCVLCSVCSSAITVGWSFSQKSFEKMYKYSVLGLQLLRSLREAKKEKDQSEPLINIYLWPKPSNCASILLCTLAVCF